MGILSDSEILLGTWVKVKVTQSRLPLCDPMDDTVHGILQARMLEWVAFPFFRGSSQCRDWTQVSRIAVDSLPAEPPGKTKNIGVGSLSLLQGIFLTQESNRALLHCRQILYQLSYEGFYFRGKFTCQQYHRIFAFLSFKWNYENQGRHTKGNTLGFLEEKLSFLYSLAPRSEGSG